MLAAAMEHHDRLSGVCAVLRGLMLHEIKRKLEHSQWGRWLKQHFAKTDREARHLMQVADDYVARSRSSQTPEGKLAKRLSGKTEPSSDLNPQNKQILFESLLASLAEVQSNRLDLSHPLVATVAAYVGNRNRSQLIKDAGPLPKGGDVAPRDPETGKRLSAPRRTKAEMEEAKDKAEAPAICRAVLAAILDLHERGLYVHVPDEDRLKLKQAVKQLHERICAFEELKRRNLGAKFKP